MKVHHSTETNHVISGINQTESFEIAQTAHFFETLSSTLYSNKRLAVVREILCNAWDAHIASGSTDIAVEVNITDTSMSIRDFGKGIHADKIKDIYCIYGASTKSNDGNQTGGFGLGSKAPFAYTETFTVKSSHNKIMNVYAISKNSEENQGRPSINTIVTVPTIQSGIEVIIPIKEINDAKIFITHVKNLVLLGGMKVSLNGTIINTINNSDYYKGFISVNSESIIDTHIRGVHIKYGNVVYPLNHYGNDIELNSLVEKINLWVKNFSYKSVGLIILAEPNSIGVTPSRESISFTAPVIKNLIKLLTNTLKEMRKIKDNNQYRNIALKQIFNSIPFTPRIDPELRQYALTYRAKEYINSPIEYNIERACNDGFEHRYGLNIKKHYYKQGHITKNMFNCLAHDDSKTYYATMHKKFLKKMYKSSVVNIDQLFVNEVSGSGRKIRTLFDKGVVHPFNPNYYKKEVLITFSKAKANYYSSKNYEHINFVYVIKDKSEEHVNAVFNFFNSNGFSIVDYTFKGDKEYSEEQLAIKQEQLSFQLNETKSKTEYNLLSGFKKKGWYSLPLNMCNSQEKGTTFDYIMYSRKQDNISSDFFTNKSETNQNSLLTSIFALLGKDSVIAIAVNNTQYDKFAKQGKGLYENLFDKAIKYYLNNPIYKEKLVEEIYFSGKFYDYSETLYNYLRVLPNYSPVKKILYPLSLTVFEQHVVNILKHFYHSWYSTKTLSEEHIKLLNDMKTDINDTIKKEYKHPIDQINGSIINQIRKYSNFSCLEEAYASKNIPLITMHENQIIHILKGHLNE